MRTALIALGIVALGLLAIAAIVVWQRVEVPPVGPSVEQICAEAMQWAPADLSGVAPNRAEKVRGRDVIVLEHPAFACGGAPLLTFSAEPIVVVDRAGQQIERHLVRRAASLRSEPRQLCFEFGRDLEVDS